MPALTSLRALLIDQLSDLYSAEQQLVEALPKMANAATGENLKQAFADHLEETKVHVTRLEKAFVCLDTSSGAKPCKAMQGLVAEGADAIELEAPGVIRDLALIGAARRVEHYEIAAYKSTRGLAGAVDEEGVADLLQQTLDDECESDKRLCTLADLAAEAGKSLTRDSADSPIKSAPPKLGKKKSK